jgi:dihydrofolate synthase/folylpolyglutamate synthase
MLTAMAFEYFAREKVDIAVLEVGMGGRLDATNVVEPVLSVITDISLDHQKFLGNTLREIGREKAGIIRPGGVVVTLPQSPDANDVIGHAILDQNARAVSAVPYVPPVSPAAARTEYKKSIIPENDEKDRGTFVTRYPVQVHGQQICVESPLVGRHQLRNIALAIAAAEELCTQGLPLKPQSIEQGIRETNWPGRFQVIFAHSPELVLDVAHNPAGAWALRAALSACFSDRSFTLVFGAMRDKAIAEIAEILFPISERVVATRADNPRSATVGEIRSAAARTNSEILEAQSVSSALETARNLTPPGGLIVITGSIYVVGEAMRELKLRI